VGFRCVLMSSGAFHLCAHSCRILIHFGLLVCSGGLVVCSGGLLVELW
jgi:hypothetical protein